MQISVTFRHVDSNEEIKEYAQEKLARLKKYMDAPMNLQVILTQEKHRHRVEVLLKSDGLSITAEEETGDFFSSIDAVIDNLERQLKKQKQKLKKQKESREERQWRYRMEVIAAESSSEEKGEPQVIVSRNLYAKPMSLEEAVMQMKLSDNEFIVFTDSSSETINVLYRRKDGNFGLIQPEIA
jgi:putative sigma-54 modulation protein